MARPRAAEERAKFTVSFPKKLLTRIDNYVASPVSSGKSRNHLIEMAVDKFLVDEELVIEILEKTRSKVVGWLSDMND